MSYGQIFWLAWPVAICALVRIFLDLRDISIDIGINIFPYFFKDMGSLIFTPDSIYYRQFIYMW
jgi:hypothetical protein